MDATVRLWGVTDGCCYKVFHGHRPSTWVKDVCFSPNGEQIISGGLDKRLVLWNLQTSAQNRTPAWEEEGHDDCELLLAN